MVFNRFVFRPFLYYTYVKDHTLFMILYFRIESRWGCQSSLLGVVWVEEVGWPKIPAIAA